VAVPTQWEHGEMLTLIQVFRARIEQMSVRVRDNGGAVRSHRTLALAALLARHAGLTFDVSTGKGTSVKSLMSYDVLLVDDHKIMRDGIRHPGPRGGISRRG